MHRTLAHCTRALLMLAVVAFGFGRLDAVAARDLPHRATIAAGAQSTEVLVWQGKVLPIVTDVYASIGALNTALQARNIDGVAKIGDQFAGELLRFQAVTPVPRQVTATAKNFTRALRNMSAGTRALVVGLRGNSSTNAQRAANQVVNGLREFQLAVDQVRRSSGPIGEPTVVPPANAGPVPTPIIKGIS